MTLEYQLAQRGKAMVDRFELRETRSGGKAGKGHNKTASIQVLSESMIKKQFRYFIDDKQSRREAIIKAVLWCQSN